MRTLENKELITINAGADGDSAELIGGMYGAGLRGALVNPFSPIYGACWGAIGHLFR